MLDHLLHLDYWLFTQINSTMASAWGDIFFPWITDLHKNPYFKFIVIPLVAFLFIKKFKREGVSLFLILLLALGASDFAGGKIKHIPKRERPFNNAQLHVVQRSEAGSYSFYSNHASNMFTLATYTSSFLPQLAIPIFTIASLVAYSRVYDGVHYPSDVFAGLMMGCLWGLLFSRLAKKLLLHLKSRKTTP
jgi:undecaprenyl-diphosphatase